MRSLGKNKTYLSLMIALGDVARSVLVIIEILVFLVTDSIGGLLQEIVSL